MKRFLLVLIGALSLALGSVAVTHRTSDASAVEAADNC